MAEPSDSATEPRRRYRQVARTIAQTPWAILPATLATIVEIVDRHVAGDVLTEEEISARLAGRPSRKTPSRAGMVAVLPLYGVIAPRATLMSNMSGGTSLYDFRVAFGEALADPDISAIVLDVDSPGGSTDLVTEMAADIRAARGRKPIVAIANTLAASAAYWLASQADEVVVTPSGEVGSIGVFAAHDDISALQEAMGVKTTLISAGKYKVEGNPFEPLSEEARQAIQKTVDQFYSMFVRDVARARGVTVQQVRDGYGEGRLVTASDAVALGMADRVETYEQTVSRLLGATTPGRSKAAASTGEFCAEGLLEPDQCTCPEGDQRAAHQAAIAAKRPLHGEDHDDEPESVPPRGVPDLLAETSAERLKRESRAALEAGRANRDEISKRKYQLTTKEE